MLDSFAVGGLPRYTQILEAHVRQSCDRRERQIPPADIPRRVSQFTTLSHLIEIYLNPFSLPSHTPNAIPPKRYKSVMQLNISRLRADDFGEYQCVLKNDLNTTVAPIYVYGKS